MKHFVLVSLVVVLAGLLAPAAQAAPGDRDPDHDRVDSRNELRQGTNPRRSDSDRDRRRDGREDADGDHLSNQAEDAAGKDPTRADSDKDGIADDRENAGVVVSHRGDRLTLRLYAGGRLTSRVEEDTDIGCGSELEAERMQRAGPERHDGRRLDLSDVVLSAEDLQDELDDDNLPVTHEDAEPGDDDDATGSYWDEGDSEAQDDHFDFEEACPARGLRAGTKIREASINDGGRVFDEIEFLIRG